MVPCGCLICIVLSSYYSHVTTFQAETKTLASLPSSPPLSIAHACSRFTRYVLHKPAVYHGKPRHTACRNGLDAAQRHSHGVTHERSERSNARAEDIMNEASRASTGRVGRRRHTIKSIEWTEAGRGRVRDVVRHVHAVISTIQREIGMGWSGEDRICNWEAIQNTPKSMPKGSMCCYCSPYSCNYGTK